MSLQRAGMKVHSVSVKTPAAKQPGAPAVATAYIQDPGRSWRDMVEDKSDIPMVVLGRLMDAAPKRSSNVIGTASVEELDKILIHDGVWLRCETE